MKSGESYQEVCLPKIANVPKNMKFWLFKKVIFQKTLPNFSWWIKELRDQVLFRVVQVNIIVCPELVCFDYEHKNIYRK